MVRQFNGSPDMRGRGFIRGRGRMNEWRGVQKHPPLMGRPPMPMRCPPMHPASGILGPPPMHMRDCYRPGPDLASHNRMSMNVPGPRRMPPRIGALLPHSPNRMGGSGHNRMGPQRLSGMGPPGPGHNRMGPPSGMGPLGNNRMGPPSGMGPPGHNRMGPPSGMGPPGHNRLGPLSGMGPSGHNRMGPPSGMGHPGPVHSRMGMHGPGVGYNRMGPLGPGHNRMGPPNHPNGMRPPGPNMMRHPPRPSGMGPPGPPPPGLFPGHLNQRMCAPMHGAKPSILGKGRRGSGRGNFMPRNPINMQGMPFGAIGPPPFRPGYSNIAMRGVRGRGFRGGTRGSRGESRGKGQPTPKGKNKPGVTKSVNKSATVSPQQGEMNKPWVTEAMKNEILKKHKLHQKAKKSKNKEDWDSFKEQRNKVTTMLREAKLEYIGAHPEEDVDKILVEAANQGNKKAETVGGTSASKEGHKDSEGDEGTTHSSVGIGIKEELVEHHQSGSDAQQNQTTKSETSVAKDV